MKLSNRARLIVIVVILVAAVAVLYTIYARQAAERNDLNARRDRAQTLMFGLGAQKVELQNQRDQALSSLNTSLAKFPRSVESIEYGEGLYKIAADCNVRIARLSAIPPADKQVGSVIYSVSSFAVAVSGGIENILEFVDALRAGDGFQDPKFPWSANVKSVNIDANASAATINLDIYGYKG